MLRTLDCFHQDDNGEWVAELSCLHGQHVRHQPPFQERPWVLTPDGRAERIGSELECPLCDRAEMPDGLHLDRIAGPFDERTLPVGLRTAHRAPHHTWAVLCVSAGSVNLSLETTPPIVRTITTDGRQTIPPEVPHAVSVDGTASLRVEFYIRARSTPPETGATDGPITA